MRFGWGGGDYRFGKLWCAMELTKRLQRSLSRIEKCGGVVLVHHTSAGSTDYQLSNGREVSASVVSKLKECGCLVAGGDGLFGGRRSNPSGGRAMSKFTQDIEARLVIINQMIPNAKAAERRALQRERSDLEEKLRKVATP